MEKNAPVLTNSGQAFGPGNSDGSASACHDCTLRHNDQSEVLETCLIQMNEGLASNQSLSYVLLLKAVRLIKMKGRQLLLCDVSFRLQNSTKPGTFPQMP